MKISAVVLKKKIQFTYKFKLSAAKILQYFKSVLSLLLFTPQNLSTLQVYWPYHYSPHK